MNHKNHGLTFLQGARILKVLIISGGWDSTDHDKNELQGARAKQ